MSDEWAPYCRAPYVGPWHPDADGAWCTLPSGHGGRHQMGSCYWKGDPDRIGSLFSGIDGLGLGLERAGVGRVVWQVEQDEFCRQILARHWPDATRYEDVTTVDWSKVEPVEVICGGFPCQPVSNAGRRKAQDDARWLWPEFHRAIRDLRPRFVVVENVAALLTRGMSDVVGDLAEIGYDAEWDCVPAAAVGAPHQRDRLFLVAYPAGVGRETAAPAYRIPDQGVLPQTGGQWRGHLERGASGRLRVTPVTGVQRVADGVPSELDLARLKALGNSVVPAVAEIIGRRVVELRGERAS